MKRFFLSALAPVAMILTMVFTGATQAGPFRHHGGYQSGHHSVYTHPNSGGYYGGNGYGYQQGGYYGGYGNGFQQGGYYGGYQQGGSYGGGYGQGHHHHHHH